MLFGVVRRDRTNVADSSKPPVKGTLKVILGEEDIPDARIPHETVEQCSVVQLKR